MVPLELALQGLMAGHTGPIDAWECRNTPQHSDQIHTFIPVSEKELLRCVASSSDVNDVASIV